MTNVLEQLDIFKTRVQKHSRKVKEVEMDSTGSKRPRSARSTKLKDIVSGKKTEQRRTQQSSPRPGKSPMLHISKAPPGSCDISLPPNQ